VSGLGAGAVGRLDRYVAAEVLRAYALVAVILGALFSLVALLEELENVGDGAYGVLDAVAFVGMTTPSRLLRLLPFVTLFGGALALWQLARRSELVVLRAAGLDLARVARILLLPTLLVAIATPVLFEFVAPALYRDATLSRDTALGRADEIAGRGFWTRRGDEIVEVGALRHGRVPTDVRLYTLAPAAGLEEVVIAASADPDAAGNWRLVDAERRRYVADRVVVEDADGELWRPWWADEGLLRAPPVDSLSFTDLRGYIDWLSSTDAPTERWELAFWRMWLLPLSALLTGLLAVPIALIGAREGGGRTLGLVLAGGLVYYLGDAIVANAGLVAGAPPLAVALVAPAILAGVLIIVLRRAG
jgi:lipopolysaccharide export system permease protein